MTPTERAAVAEAIREAISIHSSPTIDRGDGHGNRGQSGYIVWESSMPFVIASVVRALAPAPADQSDAGHGISSEELRRIDPINPGFIDALEEVNRRESDAGRIERVAEVLKNRLPFVIAGEDMRDLARVVVALSKSESDAGRDGAIEGGVARDKFGHPEIWDDPDNIICEAFDDGAIGGRAIEALDKRGYVIVKAGYLAALQDRALASAPSETVRRGEEKDEVFLSALKFLADRDAIREALEEAIAFVEDEREVRGDEDAQYEKPATPLIEKLAALAKRLEVTS